MTSAIIAEDELPSSWIWCPGVNSYCRRRGGGLSAAVEMKWKQNGVEPLKSGLLSLLAETVTFCFIILVSIF